MRAALTVTAQSINYSVERFIQGEALSSDNPKRAVFTGLAELAKALSSPNRIEIVELLREGERVLYALSDPAVVELMTALGRLRERKTAEVRSVVSGYFTERDSLEPV